MTSTTLHQFVDATTGVLSVYAAPAILQTRVEQALMCTLHTPHSPRRLLWVDDDMFPGALSTSCEWIAPVGTGALLAQALHQWPVLRFEITENATENTPGHCYRYCPEWGLWSGEINSMGTTVIPADQLASLFTSTDPQQLQEDQKRLQEMLGTVWDEALSPYRVHCPATPLTTWLSAAG